MLQQQSDLLLPFEEILISHRLGLICVHTDLQYRLIVDIATPFSCFRYLNLRELLHTHSYVTTQSGCQFKSLPTHVAQAPRSMCGALRPTKMFRMCRLRYYTEACIQHLAVTTECNTPQQTALYSRITCSTAVVCVNVFCVSHLRT